VIAVETSPQGGYVVRAIPESIGEWDVSHLPEDIARDWGEAVSVFRVGAYASSVVMCGRTLEASAEHHGVSGRTLQQRITTMISDGLITARFGQAMDYVRLIRNTGAHAGARVSHESAEGTMRFTQQSLRLLYEVPGELGRLTDHPAELDEGDEGADEGDD
jgi:hypothetical protein